MWAKHYIGFFLNYLRFLDLQTENDKYAVYLILLSACFATTFAMFLHTLRFKGYLHPKGIFFLNTIEKKRKTYCTMDENLTDYIFFISNFFSFFRNICYRIHKYIHRICFGLSCFLATFNFVLDYSWRNRCKFDSCTCFQCLSIHCHVCFYVASNHSRNQAHLK